VSAPGWVRAEAVATPDDDGRSVVGGRVFAWLCLASAAWIFGTSFFWFRAWEQGLTSDFIISPYHVPFYLGILTLVALTLGLVVRARRAGRSLRQAFPDGYGTLGVAALILLAWPIVDVGWREGIGFRDDSFEQIVAPSRLLLIAGIALIAVTPLRAALRSGIGAAGVWPVAFSAALTFTVVSVYGDFALPGNLRLEAPMTGPENDSEIWVMSGDGTRQTRLIEAMDGLAAGDAVWSPDGRQIAFTRFKRPERDGQADDVDIWVADADGSNQRPLVTGTGWQWLPHWSPDGAWLVYTVDPPGGPGGGAGLTAPPFAPGQGPAAGEQARVAPPVDVWRVRADGTGAPEQLTSEPSDDRAGVYSPDGRYMLFDSTRDTGGPSIYVTAADGSELIRATAIGDDWGGTWSPDGTRIAFNSWRPEYGGEELYIVGWPALGEPFRLTSTKEAEWAPSWSPDGSRIAFLTRRNGPEDIWSMAADGSDWRNLTRTPAEHEGLMPGGGAWGPDGRILFSRANDVPVWASGPVREDLAVAGALLLAIVLAVLVLAAFRVGGAPFGSVGLTLGLSTLVPVIGNGEWRLVPAAVVLGLLVDVLARLAPARRKAPIIGAGAAAAMILAPGLTVMATSALAWSPTLLIGVTLAAAAMGWALSGVVGGPASPEMSAARE
jgi:Tol biopolymer transport system component